MNYNKIINTLILLIAILLNIIDNYKKLDYLTFYFLITGIFKGVFFYL